MPWAVVLVSRLVRHVLVLVEEDAHDLRLLPLFDDAVDVELLHDAVHHLSHVGRLQVQDEDALNKNKALDDFWYRAGRPICRKILLCFSMQVTRACLGSR